MSPLEGRGVVAQWHSRLGQLIVHTSTQQPHIVRSGLAECLGMDEGQIRVVAPDVGGGFGYKGILLPEEIALAWATRKVGCAAQVDRGPARRPHRQRQLPRAPLHPHRLRRRGRPPAGARLRGDRRFRRLLGLSVLRLPGGGASRLHPAGALRFPALPLPRLFRRHQQAADPALPRRRPHGRVLRAGGHARRAGAQARPRVRPTLRFKSLVRPEQMPFDNIAKRHFDSGDYPEALRRAVETIGLAKVRERQQRGRARRAAHRRRLCHVLRAGRPRHQRVRRLGHPDGARPRAVPRPLRAGRRAGAQDRRAQPRPGPRDHAVAGGALDPRRAARAHPPGARRHRRDALLHGHLGLALHDHVGRRRRRRVRRAGEPRARHRRQAAAGQARGSAARRRRGGGPLGAHRRRRRGAHLVSPAAGSPRRRRSRRTGGHRRLQGQARHRHLQLRGARRRRRRRSRKPESWRSSTTSSSRTAACWSTR